MRLDGRKVLVTGGAGFIGSELVRQLIATGAEVIIVDNLVNGKRENLAEVKNHIRLEVVDIRASEEVRSLLHGVDIVYHLACLGVRHSIHSPFENHQVNAMATLQLLMMAEQQHVGRFVYVSSSEVYGTARQVPMTELHPAFPHTVYGAGKLAGECYTRAFHTTHQLPTVVVRPFNAFGPRSHHEGDSGEVIPKFMLRAMAGKPMVIFGDGQQTRDFCYVSDTARGILLAGCVDAAVGATINLGSGREVTIENLAWMIAQLLGQSPMIEYDKPRCADVLRLCTDITTAQQLLDFTPQVSLLAGLTHLLQWYQQQNISPEKLLLAEQRYNWLIEV